MFESTLTKREQVFMKADRLALDLIKKDMMSDDTLWWNKITTISEEEGELLPFSFVKKYGTFLNTIKDHNLE